MESNQDLVVVFDIESGVYSGPTDGIQLPDDKISPIVNHFLKMKDQEYIEDYELINRKITLPRYVSVGLLPWEIFETGCYENPELAFTFDFDRYTFLLDLQDIDVFLDFWQDVLDHSTNRGNILLLAHNANYDINGILSACLSQTGNRLVTMTRDWIHSHDGSYKAFPESKTDDKTFDIKIGKRHIRMVDTLNLSPGNCRSLAKYGQRASAMYGKDYAKGDQYDYDYRIYTIDDIPPKPEEIEYTKRDLQLCLFAGMMSVYSYRKQLDGLGRHYTAQNFPFSATQRDTAVNDGFSIRTRFPDQKPYQWTRLAKGRKNHIRKFCKSWGNAPDAETYMYFQNAATGGIITCNESYINIPVEDVGSMDLGSSYPACAGDFLYPRFEYGKPYTGPMDEDVFRQFMRACITPMGMELRSGSMPIDSECINHKYSIAMHMGFVARIRFHGIKFHDFGDDRNGFKYWVPILRYKDYPGIRNKDECLAMRGKIVDHDVLEYYVTHVHLIIIHAFYDWESIDYLGGYMYEMHPINNIIHDRFEAGLIGKQQAKTNRKEFDSGKISLEEFVDRTGLTYLEGLDPDTLKEEISSYYAASKVPVNAMYGANYRKLIRDQRVILEDGSYDTKPGEYDPATSVAYPTGEYIAIYGQLKIAHAMLWAISKKLPLLYVHTDSLKIQGLTPELVAEYNELIGTPDMVRYGKPVSFRSYGVGLMDYEGSHDVSVVIGNMRIISWDRDKGYSITMSGLNEQKAFPADRIRDMDIHDFMVKYLKDGARYAVDEDKASGKTTTDYLTRGLLIPGIGYSMQSILDAEFILNRPDSERMIRIKQIYNAYVDTYHDCEYYGRKRYLIRKDGTEQCLQDTQSSKKIN